MGNLGSIWGQRKEHGKDAKWLKRFKKEEQVKVEITPEKVKNILRKMPNWNARVFKVSGWKILEVFKKVLEGIFRNA